MGKGFELMPVGEIQFRNGGLRRHGLGVHQPCVRQGLQEPLEETLAEFLPPEPVQIAVPQQRKQHFFLKNRLGRRRQGR